MNILRSDSAPGTAALRNWVAQVLHFQPKVIHQPGTMMAIPDALSRHWKTLSKQNSIQDLVERLQKETGRLDQCLKTEL